MNDGFEKLREAIRQNKYIIKQHAKQRMGERQVSGAEMSDVIINGDMIEETSDAFPFPKYLFMKLVRDGEPLYVSVAFDGELAYIITVHWYDPGKWIDPWTRKR